jgi:hypothetical protein
MEPGYDLLACMSLPQHCCCYCCSPTCAGRASESGPALLAHG